MHNHIDVCDLVFFLNGYMADWSFDILRPSVTLMIVSGIILVGRARGPSPHAERKKMVLFIVLSVTYLDNVEHVLDRRTSVLSAAAV